MEWSELQVQGSQFKVTITMKGNSDKVKVEGQGLKGGYVGQELRAIVDTSEAGNGKVQCFSIHLQGGFNSLYTSLVNFHAVLWSSEFLQN